MASNVNSDLKECLDSYVQTIEEPLKTRIYTELEKELLKMKKDGQWKSQEDLLKGNLETTIKSLRNDLLKKWESVTEESTSSDSSSSCDSDESEEQKKPKTKFPETQYSLSIRGNIQNFHYGDTVNMFYSDNSKK